jgi:hypothetical protein
LNRLGRYVALRRRLKGPKDPPNIGIFARFFRGRFVPAAPFHWAQHRPPRREDCLNVSGTNNHRVIPHLPFPLKQTDLAFV